MSEEHTERRLAAILAADVAGYSRVMEADEEGTLSRLKALRQELFDPGVANHRGRIVKTTGDGALVEFASSVDALRCAVELQRALGEHNTAAPDDERLLLRIGINIGDIIIDDEDIYGTGVNVAARLEALAQPGGICISDQVLDQVEKNVEVGFAYLGPQSVKNIERPVNAWNVLLDPADAGKVVGAPGEARETKRTKRSWQAAVALALIFAGGLGIWFHQSRPDIEPARAEQMAFPLPDKPSIAVLPFDNLSGDTDQDYLGDGITENIIASLSKISQILVIARNSAFTYKNKPVKVQRVAEELGVRYVLEGSVQRSGEKLRVTAQLIDAVKGHHLWSERYDRQMQDLFDVQDDITREIVLALHVKFTEGEEARIRHRLTNDLEAWEYAVRGYALFERFTKEDNARARELFQRAVELDPQYAWVLAKLGFTYLIDARFGFSEDPNASFEKALDIALKTLELDDGIADGYMLLATIRLTQRRYEEALELGRKAVALDPNYPQAHANLAHVTRDLGQWDQTIELTNSAVRLHPHHPAWYFLSPSTAYVFKDAYDQAVLAAEEGARKAESEYLKAVFYRQMAFAHMEAGREKQARRSMMEGQRLNPATSEWYRGYFRFKNPDHLDRMLTALRKAGLPDQ